ncbi:hypothetical protein [Sphaerisporangium sp. NPDC051011]|uniref:hypothetical protein n=1 Tax=Sphaerisporangium sp. NPDC051011 TaxID=3155792 RepID=UPI0033E9810D
MYQILVRLRRCRIDIAVQFPAVVANCPALGPAGILIPYPGPPGHRIGPKGKSRPTIFAGHARDEGIAP